MSELTLRNRYCYYDNEDSQKSEQRTLQSADGLHQLNKGEIPIQNSGNRQGIGDLLKCPCVVRHEDVRKSGEGERSEAEQRPGQSEKQRDDYRAPEGSRAFCR